MRDMAFQKENAKFKCAKCNELNKTFNMLESRFCPFAEPMNLSAYKRMYQVETQEANVASNSTPHLALADMERPGSQGEQLADPDKRPAKITNDEDVQIYNARVCYECELNLRLDARDKGEILGKLPPRCHGEAGVPGRQGNEGPDDMYYTLGGVKRDAKRQNKGHQFNQIHQLGNVVFGQFLGE